MKPTFLVIGIDHFSNQDNGNMFTSKTEGILTDKRQNEISYIVDCLEIFKPTKIALEVLIEAEEELNQDYIAYQTGHFSLSSNEIHQIGFRLAKKCNLGKLNAVDWNDDQDGIPDFRKLAEDNNQLNIFNDIEKMGQEFIMQSEQHYQVSLKEFLLWHNEEENIAKGHEVYMKLALIGSGSNSVGAAWTANYWYYRNMLIYKNLVNLINSPEERILVLYGSGHLHLLLQFLKESRIFNVEVASDYLR
ncbi:DUF5694 domain-containing protein [Rummeliibacillus stabekisii]|uniref:Uncharacterized protein n=1 Tax=Rummeliibacillus stabekisii TaxID=241244 RepID=A0A143HE47_9BACL|nr:DUF5694 domain-containing protein [Rummeliibacillus stabekisii]AMW99760.1 hypothetical protein ATY39_10100 [Rummeliibacillus stabekisii]